MPRDVRSRRGCVQSEVLFHTHARHRHVRVKNVALSLPHAIRLLRHQHPLAMVDMSAVGAGDHERPRAVAQIAAALGGCDCDLDLGRSPRLRRAPPSLNYPQRLPGRRRAQQPASELTRNKTAFLCACFLLLETQADTRGLPGKRQRAGIPVFAIENHPSDRWGRRSCRPPSEVGKKSDRSTRLTTAEPLVPH